jgi:NADPH2:quinone reductase
MHAILIDRPGGPEALQYRETPVPQPAAGEVLVKIAASGVNFIDCYHRSGLYPIAQKPFTPGLEAAGTIEAVGPGVAGFAAGDRVAYTSSIGAYAEYAVVPARVLVRVPEGVELSDAAALLLQGLTAQYLAEDTFHLKPGDVALVHAGAGGVGLLLTQLAKTRGAVVITTVSTSEKAELSKAAGADHVLNYTEVDFKEEARKLTGGRGVDVVYDSVGKTTFDKSLESIRPRGLLALFGASSGPVPPFELQRLAANGSLFITRPTLFNHISEPGELTKRAAELFAAVASGALKLRIGHRYPLAEAARAHTDLEARATTGKLLLIP